MSVCGSPVLINSPVSRCITPNGFCAHSASSHRVISLDLNGSLAEQAAPKLPLTVDNRPPPFPTLSSFLYYPPSTHTRPPSNLYQLSTSLLVSYLYVLILPSDSFCPCLFYFLSGSQSSLYVSFLDRAQYIPRCCCGAKDCSLSTNNLA